MAEPFQNIPPNRPDRAATTSSGRKAVLLACLLLASTLSAQTPVPPELPSALTRMIETERAFAARALVVGWKQSFLEYFDDDAVGFDQGRAAPAKEQFRESPDPAKDLQLIWEPRYGDVAGSGELGYLTGPVRNILPTRNNGQPRHSTYFSVWKRQRNGTYRVLLDVGTPTPGPAPFAPGFTRALHASRFTGDFDDRTPPLSAADSVMNSALRTNQASAYRERLAPGARLHRRNMLPLVGERAILTWLASQGRYSAADSRHAEAARSGDLGYTWGTYIIAARGKTPREEGFYTRVWVRERNGQWRIAADITQPQ
jgi:ketosteroid isomerase-like protein